MLKGPGAFAVGRGRARGGGAGGAQAPGRGALRRPSRSPTGASGRTRPRSTATPPSSDGKVAFRLNGRCQGTDGYRDGRDGEIARLQSRPRLAARRAHARRRSRYEYLSSDQSARLAACRSSTARSPVPRARPPTSRAFDLVRPGRCTASASTRERRLNDTFLLRDKLYSRELDWVSHGTLIVGAFPFPGRPDLRAAHAGPARRQPAPLGNQLELVASFHTGSSRTSSSPARGQPLDATPTPRTRSSFSRST